MNTHHTRLNSTLINIYYIYVSYSYVEIHFNAKVSGIYMEREKNPTINAFIY